MRGYLLDINPSGRDEVILWVKRLDGRVVSHRIKWMPRIYVHGPLENLVKLGRLLSQRYLIDFVERSVKPGSPPETVLEIRVPFGSKKRVANLILDLGNHQLFKVYNVDLPSMQEFLYQHELHPTALIDLSSDGLKVLDSIEDIDYDLSWVRAAHLDAKVEASSIAPRFSDRLREVVIEMDGERIILDGAEDGILQDLMKTLDDLDIDVIITDGGDSFLLPYLHYRAHVNRVKLRLGRANDPRNFKPSSSTYLSYGRVYCRFRGFKLKGRIHIDSSNSMLYRETGLDGLIEVSRVARIPIQDAARYTIGSCMSSLQYYQAYRLGILIPWKPSKTVYMDCWSLNRADRGGLILDAKIGVYWNVAELDFKSLYPTLMLKHNISGETVNCECCKDDGERIPELGYHVCKRWKGIVPRAIELPLRKRMMYKELIKETRDGWLRTVYKSRSDALKWILVTAFGYLGYRNAKFGSREAHLAVCALARETLLKAIRIAEENGFEVIHGIVDSLWVRKEDADDQDYLELAKKIEEEIGLPISYEGRYRWIVFLPSRAHPDRPANNRYFGVFLDGRLKYRGIEARRRDVPPIVKKMQLEILEKLAEARDPEQLRKRVVEALEIYRGYARRLILGDVSIEDLAITQVLSMDPDDYVVEARQAVAAKHLERAGIRIAPGQAITYVIAGAGGLSKAVPIQLIRESSYRLEPYLRMLEKAAYTMITPVLESLRAPHRIYDMDSL